MHRPVCIALMAFGFHAPLPSQDAPGPLKVFTAPYPASSSACAAAPVREEVSGHPAHGQALASWRQVGHLQVGNMARDAQTVVARPQEDVA